MKVRDVLKIIIDDGRYHIKTENDQSQFKHPTKKWRVTVAGHPNVDVPPKTLVSIFRQAQLPMPRRK